MIWRSVLITWSATLRAPIPWLVKLRLLGYIIKRVLLRPFGVLLWHIDRIIMMFLKEPAQKPPVYIISHPRSGSTFLHRTLAMDDKTFFAVTYLEWRWPYLCVWMLIDLLGLRQRINQWSYWPNTELGRFAAELHPHTWGDYEEHGIFLEEKCFTHYFMFRRFPFSAVLNNSRSHQWSCSRTVKMLLYMLEVVDKVDAYRGNGRSWLTKENETLYFYQTLIGTRPGGTIWLERNHEECISSYDLLSLVSTKAKLGIDPRRYLPGWFKQNAAFREEEDAEFAAAHRYGVYVRYEALVQNPHNTIKSIYEGLGIYFPYTYSLKLAHVNQRQAERITQ